MRARLLTGALVLCAIEGLASGCPPSDLAHLQDAATNAPTIVVARRIAVGFGHYTAFGPATYQTFRVQRLLKGRYVPERIEIVGSRVDVEVGDTALMLLTPTPVPHRFVAAPVGGDVRSFPVVGDDVKLGGGAMPLPVLAGALGLRPAAPGIDWQRTTAYLLLFAAVGVVGFEIGRRAPRR
jgi:hypothetical protein